MTTVIHIHRCPEGLYTPPKFNMEPENDGFQKESPFPGVDFRFHIKLQGYIQTSFQIHQVAWWKKTKLTWNWKPWRWSCRWRWGLRGAWISKEWESPKNPKAPKEFQIIHRFGWLGGGLVYVLCSKVFGVTIVGEFLRLKDVSLWSDTKREVLSIFEALFLNGA